MKDAQAASGFLQPSRTVPASGVNLAPHAGHLRLRTPEGPNPSLQAGEAPHRGQGGGGRNISAASASVPEPVSSRSLRSSTASDRSSSPAGVSGPTSPAQGFACFMAGSSHPPERPPGGIAAKQRSGWALGHILCLARIRMARPCGPRHLSPIWVTVRLAIYAAFATAALLALDAERSRHRA